MGNINIGKLTLILVDDDKDLLFLMKRLLVQEGFVVKLSHNGKDLHDIIRTETPDLILLDITMDGVDGAEICSELKSVDQTKAIPILLLSSNENIAERARQCGADGYFSKPLEIELLKQQLSLLI